MKESPSTRLGDFELAEILGSGGEASVWRSTHLPTGKPAAIKLVAHRWARQPAARRALAREIRRLGALCHPGIVSLLDCGEVTEAEASSGHLELVAGTPWLAQELVPGGTLAALVDREVLTAEEPGLLPEHLLDLLFQLLSALGFAHARGILHLDLTDQNVLLDATRRRIKLVDFGLAHWIGGGLAPSSAGTARAMAPERIDRSRGPLGPWTDLYSLGCLAYQLQKGWPPFVGSDAIVRRWQLEEPPPGFPDLVDVPGLEEWTLRALAKDPAERFPSAAEAARELERATGHTPRGDSIPELPPRPLGVGAFSLRNRPPMGRADPLARLHSTLDRVAAACRAEQVHLSGERGVGKSAVAHHFASELRERGRAQVFGVGTAGTGTEPIHMRGMVLRWLGLEALPRETAEIQLPTALRIHGLQALQQPLAVWLLDSGATRAEGFPTELLRNLLTRLCEQSPVVVVAVGELAGDEDRFLDALCTSELPLLAVRVGGPHQGSSSEWLKPLAPEVLAAALQQAAPLDPFLAERIARRAGGNPGFAAALVDQLIAEGRLVRGEHGCSIPDDAPLGLPQTAVALWRGRAETAVAEGLAPIVLAITTALRHAKEQEWRAVMEHARLPVGPEALGQLHELGLVELGDDAYRVADGIHEALAGMWAAAGLWKEANRLCAEALEPRLVGADRQRLGELYSQAERPDLAYLALLPAVEDWLLHSRYGQALQVSQALEAAWSLANRVGAQPQELVQARLQALLGMGENDALVQFTRAVFAAGGREWTTAKSTAMRFRSKLALRGGELEIALALALHTVEKGRTLSDDLEKARVRLCLSEALKRLDSCQGAIDAAREALELVPAPTAHVQTRGECLAALGSACARAGRLDEANRYLAEASECFDDIGNLFGQAWARTDLGNLISKSEPERAEQLLMEARDLFTAIGSGQVWSTLMNLGGIALDSRRPEQALGYFEAALASRTGRNHTGWATMGALAAAALCADWPRCRRYRARLEGTKNEVDASADGAALLRLAARAARQDAVELSTWAEELATWHDERLGRPDGR